MSPQELYDTTGMCTLDVEEKEEYAAAASAGVYKLFTMNDCFWALSMVTRSPSFAWHAARASGWLEKETKMEEKNVT